MSQDGPSGGDPRLPDATAPPRWGLGDAAAGFGVGLVLSGVLASAWLGVTGDDELSLAGEAVSELGLWTGLVGCVLLASRRKGAGRLDADFGLTARWPDVGVGVVAGVLCQIVLVPVMAFLLRPLLGQPDVSGPAEDLFDRASGVATVILLLFVVVGAPIVEELFFRGLLLRSFERRFGPIPAILLSAALFGMAHPQPLEAKALALVMVTLAALGVVLGALAVRTGRLAAPIIAHVTFNAWTSVLLLTG